MEPVAALGFACNVLQLIGSAQAAISCCKRIYDTGSPVDPSLKENAAAVATLADSIAARCASTTMSSAQERKLQEVANRCTKTSRKLQDEILYCTANAGRSRLSSTMAAAAKTFLRRRTIERLEKAFEDCRRTLETHLLGDLCSRQEAARIATQQSFTGLNRDLQQFISAYAAGQTQLCDLVMKMCSTTKDSITSHVDKALLYGLRSVHLVSQQEESRRRLLGSLKYSGMNERRNHVADSYPDTFRWVFENGLDSGVDERAPSQTWPSFPQWVTEKPESGGAMYWISGKPGSGKSTLVRYIITSPSISLLLKSASPETLVLRHFLWRPGTEMQQNIKGLLCSLLHQLLSVDSGALALDKLARKFPNDQDSDWSVRDLKTSLIQAVSEFLGTVYIFIDGLDEVSVKDRPLALLELIKDFNTLPNTKVCVSSRPEPQFRRRLENFPTLRIHEITAPDIRTFVTGTLNFPPGAAGHEWQSVVGTIVRRSEGVFLWARLVVRSVQSGIDNGDSPEEIWARISTLPSDMGDLYYEMWQRLNEDKMIYRQSAALFFNLMTTMPPLELYRPIGDVVSPFSAPISLFDLAIAYHNVKWDTRIPTNELVRMCQATAKQVVVRCAGLLEVCTHPYTTDVPTHLEVYYKTQQIQFVHRTARDFLATEQGLEILAHDMLNQEERFLRLVHAAFHQSKAFYVDDDAVPRHCIEYAYTAMHSFRKIANHVSKRVMSDAISVSELWYTGHAMTANTESTISEGVRGVPAFLAIVAASGFREEVSKRIMKSSYDPETLSTALFGACCSPNREYFPLTLDICGTIRDLVSWGASITTQRRNPHLFFRRTGPIPQDHHTPLAFLWSRVLQDSDGYWHPYGLSQKTAEEIGKLARALAAATAGNPSSAITAHVSYACPASFIPAGPFSLHDFRDKQGKVIRRESETTILSPQYDSDGVEEQEFQRYQSIKIGENRWYWNGNVEMKQPLKFSLVIELLPCSVAGIIEKILRQESGLISASPSRPSHTAEVPLVGISCKAGSVRMNGLVRRLNLQGSRTNPDRLMQHVAPCLFESPMRDNWKVGKVQGGGREWAVLVFQELSKLVGEVIDDPEGKIDPLDEYLCGSSG